MSFTINNETFNIQDNKLIIVSGNPDTNIFMGAFGKLIDYCKHFLPKGIDYNKLTDKQKYEILKNHNDTQIILSKLLSLNCQKIPDNNDGFYNLRLVCDIILCNDSIIEFTNICNSSFLEYLTFTNVKLVNVPKQIHKLQNLKYLNLEYNSIVNLPEEIFQLNQLETLQLSNNKIVSLPSITQKQYNLKNLFLSINNINNISFNIKLFPNLKIFTFYGNPSIHIGDQSIIKFMYNFLPFNKQNIHDFLGTCVISDPNIYQYLPLDYHILLDELNKELQLTYSQILLPTLNFILNSPHKDYLMQILHNNLHVDNKLDIVLFLKECNYYKNIDSPKFCSNVIKQAQDVFEKEELKQGVRELYERINKVVCEDTFNKFFECI